MMWKVAGVKLRDFLFPLLCCKSEKSVKIALVPEGLECMLGEGKEVKSVEPEC